MTRNDFLKVLGLTPLMAMCRLPFASPGAVQLAVTEIDGLVQVIYV